MSAEDFKAGFWVGGVVAAWLSAVVFSVWFVGCERPAIVAHGCAEYVMNPANGRAHFEWRERQ